jgi:hypothetical protein
VSSGQLRWQATHSKPVWRANAGTAREGAVTDIAATKAVVKRSACFDTNRDTNHSLGEFRRHATPLLSKDKRAPLQRVAVLVMKQPFDQKNTTLLAFIPEHDGGRTRRHTAPLERQVPEKIRPFSSSARSRIRRSRYRRCPARRPRSTNGIRR